MYYTQDYEVMSEDSVKVSSILKKNQFKHGINVEIFGGRWHLFRVLVDSQEDVEFIKLYLKLINISIIPIGTMFKREE